MHCFWCCVFCEGSEIITCVQPNVFSIVFTLCSRARSTYFVMRNRQTYDSTRFIFATFDFARQKQAILAFQKKSTNVWHDARNGFSARKLPNTTKIVVSATRTASCFRSTKIVLRASRHPQTLRIQWFERLGAFRSIKIVHSASASSRLEASERRNPCVCSAKRV